MERILAEEASKSTMYVLKKNHKNRDQKAERKNAQLFDLYVIAFLLNQ